MPWSLWTLLTSGAAILTLALSAASSARGEEKKAEGEKAEGEKAEAKPKPVTASDHYVQSWIPMPAMAAASVSGGDQVQLRPTPGRAQIIIFLASWCEPCQQLMPELQRLEKHYQPLSVDFVYMFAHDTRDDAQGFVKEFQMNEAYLANQSVLTAYHNPDLPGIYLADRHGWLSQRYLKAGPSELKELDRLLKLLVAY